MSQYFTDYAEKDRRLIFCQKKSKIWPWVALAVAVVAIGLDWVR